MRRSELELKKSSILRKELLEDIYSFPRIATETYYSGYSDGILYGLEWISSNKNIKHHVITPGALKYHGKIYFLAEQIEVEDVLQDEIKLDKNYRLCFEEQEAYKDIETQTIYELKLRAVQSGEYERIKDKSFYYSRVRCIDEGCLEEFYDGDIYGLFASEDGYDYKLPNWILKDEIQILLQEKSNKHPLDYMILKDIFEKRGLSVSMAILYLNECKISISKEDYYLPDKLIEKLKQAIGSLKSEIAVQVENKPPIESTIEEPMGGGLL